MSTKLKYLCLSTPYLRVHKSSRFQLKLSSWNSNSLYWEFLAQNLKLTLLKSELQQLSSVRNLDFKDSDDLKGFGVFRSSFVRKVRISCRYLQSQNSAARWQHFFATTFLELFQLGQGTLGLNAKSNPYTTRMTTKWKFWCKNLTDLFNRFPKKVLHVHFGLS